LSNGVLNDTTAKSAVAVRHSNVPGVAERVRKPIPKVSFVDNLGVPCPMNT
jgi:hypothetical protein